MPDPAGIQRVCGKDPEMRGGRSRLPGSGGTGRDGMHQGRDPDGFPSQPEIGGSSHPASVPFHTSSGMAI